jgi:hypothetical protein
MLRLQEEFEYKKGVINVHTLKSDSTLHFFWKACTKSGSLRFSQFSGCWLILSVYIIMSFDFPFVRLFEIRSFCYYPYLMDEEQTMQWRKEIWQKDKQFSTNHYKEN